MILILPEIKQNAWNQGRINSTHICLRLLFIYFQVDNLFRLMDDIFIKSLQSVQRVMINDKHCFELYPFLFLPKYIPFLIKDVFHHFGILYI